MEPVRHRDDMNAPSSTRLPRQLNDLLSLGVTSLQRAQAENLGISTVNLTRWNRIGYLQSVGYGGYVIIQDGPSAETPWAAHARRHLARARAVCEGFPGSYLVGLTAAMAHDLRPLEQPDAIAISRSPAIRSRRPHVQPKPPWGLGAVGEVEGASELRVQGVAEAVVEVAAGSGLRSGLVVANRALAIRRTTPRELAEASERFGTRKGSREVAAMLALADERIDRAIETLMFLILHNMGLRAIPQFEVRDEHGGWVARVDFLIEGTCVVVETDGLEKYQSPGDLRNEKVRELDIQRAGYRVIRFVWQGMRYPERVRSRVLDALGT